MRSPWLRHTDGCSGRRLRSISLLTIAYSVSLARIQGGEGDKPERLTQTAVDWHTETDIKNIISFNRALLNKTSITYRH